ncbi:MAG: hypothetical protein AB1442_07735 [Nitrospirota bacterium]
MANKAELNGYSEEPFYKPDKDYEEARFIAWAGGATQQAQLFWSLAEVVGERIDYLLKEEIDKNSDGIVWRRIFGGILYDDLKSVVESDEDLFFHDSGFQMCLRIPDSDDYFAFDDHGIFWIYSDDKRFLKALEKSGLSERDAPLISDSAHWHVRPKDAEERLNSFIEKLMSLSKFCEREDTEPGA